MLVALVVAHPSPDSYCHALAARAAAGLRAGGHDVEILDLYGAGFRVAMTAEERRAYHGETPIVDPIVAEHADLLTRAQALVFVYPTWWSGLPAILKGWLERVMVPGVGFRFDERTHKVRPGLGQVRHIIGISTYGSPRTYVRLDQRQRATHPHPGAADELRVPGPTHVARLLRDRHVDASTAREEFAARVEREMAALR